MDDQRRVDDRSHRWQAANLPLPEAHLVGVATALGLHRVRRATLPGHRRVYRVAGSSLIVAATWLISRSVTIAGKVDLDHPGKLVTAGPYAVSRNPM